MQIVARRKCTKILKNCAIHANMMFKIITNTNMHLLDINDSILRGLKKQTFWMITAIKNSGS